VTLKGNKYFETDLLKERMQVQKADAYLRSGRYSPALVTRYQLDPGAVSGERI
jgi:outer membrane protein insertion porin family